MTARTIITKADTTTTHTAMMVASLEAGRLGPVAGLFVPVGLSVVPEGSREREGEEGREGGREGEREGGREGEGERGGREGGEGGREGGREWREGRGGRGGEGGRGGREGGSGGRGGEGGEGRGGEGGEGRGGREGCMHRVYFIRKTSSLPVQLIRKYNFIMDYCSNYYRCHTLPTTYHWLLVTK